MKKKEPKPQDNALEKENLMERLFVGSPDGINVPYECIIDIKKEDYISKESLIIA